MDEIMNNAVEETTEDVIERVYDIDGRLVYVIFGSTIILVGAIWMEKKFGFGKKLWKKLTGCLHKGKKVVTVDSEEVAEAVANGEIDIEELN